MKFKAPGKVILFGEYAVLSGYPALVVAIDRYAELRYEDSPHFKVIADGLGRYDPAQDMYELPFAKALHELCPNVLGCWHTDTKHFQTDHHKLGLGSSAAATVVMAAAALDFAGTERSQVYQLAQNAHRSMQGLGSGADIAASVFGGTLRYTWSEGDRTLSGRTENTVNTQYGKARIKRLDSNDMLKKVRMVWSEQSANTRTLVQTVQTFAAQYQSVYQALLEDIHKATEAALFALLHEDRRSMCSAIRAGSEAVRRLGNAAGISLHTHKHHEIEHIIGCDGAMKPTGAGGGDLAWFMGETPAQEQVIADRLRHAGFSVFEFAVAEGLVRIGTTR